MTIFDGRIFMSKTVCMLADLMAATFYGIVR